MARYSIEDTTLTALGDAIRGKVGETKEIDVPLEPHRLSYNESIDGVEDFTPEGATLTKKIVFPIRNDVKKVKIIYSFKKYHSLDKLYLTVEKANTGFSVATKTVEEDCENQTVYLTHTYTNNEAMQVGVKISLPGYSRGQYDASFDVTIYQLNNNDEIIETVKQTVTNTMTPSTMVNAINNMAATPPDEAFEISGNCQYKFSYGGWDWFIELFGNKIKTNDVNNCNSMFTNSNVEVIPFDINIASSVSSLSYMFNSCTKLKTLPKINANTKIPVPKSKSNFVNIENLFNYSHCIREIPEDYLDTQFEEGYWEAKETLKADGKTGMARNMYSLRKIPTNLYKAYRGYGTGYYNSLYYNIANNSYALDEVVGLPVEPGPYTGNTFASSFSSCYRLGRLTFETNEDGTPKTANWKSQTIDLSDRIGYIPAKSYENTLIQYNSGITADKKVDSDETYAALKDNPDWYALGLDYSRYNKSSAIETINTLPDVSGSGGTNTIKFKGASGAKTDGGAINTMTEAEIAVATAKGWTVTMA